MFPHFVKTINQFQSTLLRRSDYTGANYDEFLVIFQSTLLRRSDGCGDRYVDRDASNFNPRSCEGATTPHHSYPNTGTDFNPRSCEGATDRGVQSRGIVLISIHAPAKERRNISLQDARWTEFQSTLLRRSDQTQLIHQNYSRQFQSTLLRRSDMVGVHQHTKLMLFQSTLLRRSDQLKLLVNYQFLAFQSTLLRRSDNFHSFSERPLLYFNPRSCEGATICVTLHHLLSYFNPRSCEGATGFGFSAGLFVTISIHAPAKERQQNCTNIPFVLSFLLDNYTHSILFKQAFPFAFTSNHSDFHVFLVRIS